MLKQEKNEDGDRGWIINISSILGVVGGYTVRKSSSPRNLTCADWKASYAASKGAVTNLTRSVALDYAKDGIHCNAICPGCKSHNLKPPPRACTSDGLTRNPTDTETAIFADTIKMHSKEDIRAKHPLHGTGKPQDIVGAAIFLASAEARWITGVNLPVDGGYTAQ